MIKSQPHSSNDAKDALYKLSVQHVSLPSAHKTDAASNVFIPRTLPVVQT